MGKTYTLDQLQIIARPRHEVFDFFSRAENLEKLTPDLLRFSVKTPLPIEMKPGALIDYRLALFGVPMNWRTKIEVWEPEVRFVDTQLKGPYKLWHHEHLFRDVPGGTEMTDHLRYQVGFGPFRRGGAGALRHADRGEDLRVPARGRGARVRVRRGRRRRGMVSRGKHLRSRIERDRPRG